MEFYTIPVEDNRYILYRPLLRKAFLGNAAMVRLVEALLDDPDEYDIEVPGEVKTFLDDLGFLHADPPAPGHMGRDFHPTTAVLLLTNRCNLRCTYCYADAGVMPAADLSTDLAYSVIDRVVANAQTQGAPHFEVSFHGGGEPMQAWQVIKAATAYARRQDIPSRITLVSNGVWSRQQREWALANLDGVTISIDGGPATQDQQRPLPNGAGSYKYVLTTLQALDEAEFNYGIRMTATAPWRERFPADVQYLCEATRCRLFQVEPAFNVNRGEHQEAQQDEAQAFVDGFIAAFDIARSAGRELLFSGARLGLVTRTFCSAPYNALIVNAAGQLVTCYEIASDSHALAEISTIGEVTDSGIAINQPARDYLLDFVEDKQAHLCQECFAKWHCAGDCYTRSSFVEDDGLRVSTSRCFINQEITAQLLLWNIMRGGGVWNGQTAENHFQPMPTSVVLG
ncbi:MAG: radical SAM protein [Chloroflexi bacterium]|nr:radical SAM protein [Chloroflexota bacterium]